MDRLLHVLLGCWLTGAFFVISVAAYYLLKNKHLDIARSMMKLGLLVAAVSLVLQLWSGDRSGRIVAKYQPAKLAAFEGVYETTSSTPITVAGWVDTKERRVIGLRIPGGLSYLVYRQLERGVPGLDQIPEDEWPNVQLVFQTFHIMVATWGLMALIAALCIYQMWRGRLQRSRTLLKAAIFAVALPHIGQQTGWITAEVGRQPWIVWHLLRTQDGVSTAIIPEQVIGSLIMFTCIYALLASLFFFLLDRKIKHGPETAESDLIYRTPYTTP